VLALRQRQIRNFLATLMLSQGVPMIRGGDELGHTQQGNNNTYCQDNDLSWMDWNLQDWQQRLLEFACRMTRLRARNPVLRRRQFFQGRAICGDTATDIVWLTREGNPMTTADWHAARARVLGVCLNGQIDEVDERGRPISGATLLIFFSAEDQEIRVRLPHLAQHNYWRPLLDTARLDQVPRRCPGGTPYTLRGRCCAVFGLRSTWVKAVHRFVTRRTETMPRHRT
jgi:glycogen operon protein